MTDREAEARRAFPWGAWQPRDKNVWLPVKDPTPTERRHGYRPDLLPNYLPLEAPDSRCPECEGLGHHPLPSDAFSGYLCDPCYTCDGSGSTPGDSILSRLRAGDPEWIAILDGVKR